MFPVLIYFVRTHVVGYISTLKTSLFLFINLTCFTRSRHFHFGEHRKCCIVIYIEYMANCCSEPVWCFLLQCDKLPSPHFLQALFESVNLSAPVQYRAKRQPRYFPNGIQYSTETILDFVFRGRSNWKLGWICQFDLALTAWQIWKGQIWNSKVFQLRNRKRVLYIWRDKFLWYHTTKQRLMTQNHPVKSAIFALVNWHITFSLCTFSLLLVCFLFTQLDVFAPAVSSI